MKFEGTNIMKIVEIIGDNYYGKWESSRTACRAIVINNGKMLLSYETATQQWMIPGGGLENGEDEKDCCCREVAEETGIVVKAEDCFLEIDEYYEDWKWINKYYVCEMIGETTMNLTDREKAVGMEPRWVDVEEVKAIFSAYDSFAETDKMRSGMYYREYTALCESEGMILEERT